MTPDKLMDTLSVNNGGEKAGSGFGCLFLLMSVMFSVWALSLESCQALLWSGEQSAQNPICLALGLAVVCLSVLGVRHLSSSSAGKRSLESTELLLDTGLQVASRALPWCNHEELHELSMKGKQVVLTLPLDANAAEVSASLIITLEHDQRTDEEVLRLAAVEEQFSEASITSSHLLDLTLTRASDDAWRSPRELEIEDPATWVADALGQYLERRDTLARVTLCPEHEGRELAQAGLDEPPAMDTYTLGDLRWWRPEEEPPEYYLRTVRAPAVSYLHREGAVLTCGDDVITLEQPFTLRLFRAPESQRLIFFEVSQRGISVSEVQRLSFAVIAETRGLELPTLDIQAPAMDPDEFERLWSVIQYYGRLHGRMLPCAARFSHLGDAVLEHLLSNSVVAVEDER